MASAIEDARMDAIAAAYDDVTDELGLSVDYDASDWEDSVRDEAAAAASSIAATYLGNLTSAATRFINDYARSHDTLDGARAALASYLSKWAANRATWKSQQIAQYEVGQSADDGVFAAISDLVDGEYDEDLADLYGDEAAETLLDDSVYIVVLPETAEEPFCEAYAGEEFAVEDAEEVQGLFPAHEWCDHYTTVLFDPPD